jgi:PII-like signaling protein
MTLEDPTARLTIYLGAADLSGPRHDDIVRRAHEAGLAAAIVQHAPQPELETGAPRTILLSHPASVTVTILDTEPKLRAFVRELDDLNDAGITMRLEGVDVRSQVGAPQRAARTR